MGETKKCPCIICGTLVEVTKFATPAKVKCDACKGSIKEVARKNAAALPEVILHDMVDAFLALHLDFPACPKNPNHDIELKSVVDGQHGAIATFQCLECNIVISISTQHRRQLLQQGARFSNINHSAFRESVLGAQLASDNHPGISQVDDSEQ